MRRFTIKEWDITLRGRYEGVKKFRGSGKTRMGAISSVFKSNGLSKDEWSIVSVKPPAEY